MSSALIGRWENQYGSLLDIGRHDDSGSFEGIYRSSTGSPGQFRIAGWSPPADHKNLPVSFGVRWRNTSEGERDPTWEWVSSMCGGLFLDTPDSVPILQVQNNLVVSAPYGQLDIHRPGIYVETLTFRKSKAEHISCPAESKNLTQGTLTLLNEDAASSYRSLKFAYDDSGLVTGTLDTSEHHAPISGFTDFQTRGNLQSLALTGLFPGGTLMAFGLAGNIDLVSGAALLSLNECRAVSYLNRYAVGITRHEKFVLDVTRHEFAGG
ncbi:avidin/streptavidin family protein [Burkholderia thailandensis]|uniref:avidin/streptavidin family protein n=1 Tax=Burkholderia thailandensis TaxID=57975 RepID=UPI002D784B75|nr:avidin/streptavidin family protein [Burkholderia thailandensis]WRS69945.1 avidin/streptavidin family protein [Burkholderia thailandensis]